MKVTKAMHSQAVKDLEYIEEKYGYVDDFCGGFCNTENYTELLRSPTLNLAYKHIVSLLTHYMQAGNERLHCGGNGFDVKDDRTGQIIKKYCL